MCFRFRLFMNLCSPLKCNNILLKCLLPNNNGDRLSKHMPLRTNMMRYDLSCHSDVDTSGYFVKYSRVKSFESIGNVHIVKYYNRGLASEGPQLNVVVHFFYYFIY